MQHRWIRFPILFIMILTLSIAVEPVYAYAEMTTETMIAQITTAKGPLKLREKPAKQGKVLCEIPQGTLLAVADCDDGWYAASYGEQDGYLMKAFVTVLENADAALLDYKTLRSGDAGDEVLACKQRLMELGYYRSSSKMTNRYNATLAERVRIFERVNGMEEDGIASAQMQALLYSENAIENTEPLPAATSSTHYGASSSSGSSDDGWHQEICECCNGRGCDCCDYTGYIWVPD